MSEMSWSDAVSEVLKQASEPIHYSDIAQAIIDNGYRSNVGSTPANAVASTISQYLQRTVVRTKPGYYILATKAELGAHGASSALPKSEAAEDAEEMGLISAFGMFWRRSGVDWDNKVRILGVQKSGAQAVDFAEQAGVYLLYDGARIIYVGRTTTGPGLGARLKTHTRDRLSGRWDRFSWFGVREVGDDGELQPQPSARIGTDTLIATMEALLIEGLEPPQNRRQGDGFNALEFLQVTDESIENKKMNIWLTERLGLR